MQVVICAVNDTQVTAIGDAIRSTVTVRSEISLDSIYTIQSPTGPRAEILIVLIPSQKATEEDLVRLEDLRWRITRKLSLDSRQVVCAREWH